ncbi:MAG: class II aldolase/adducin family protein [Deltaproteobacteria bacterium]|nr:class II aldolase/adducin family protein [Deltaproteobacteria bacterium]
MINHRCEKETCDIIKHLHKNGFMSDGIFSAVSIRDSQTQIIYMSPRLDDNFKLKSWGYLRPEDIVAVDMGGNSLKEYSPLPPLELSVHLSIYRDRPSMNSIMHIHPEHVSAFSAVKKDMHPVMVEDVKTMIGGENGIVRCAPFTPYCSEAFTASVMTALSPDKKAIFLQANGAICIGEDTEEAYSMCTILERQAQMEIYATSLGRVNYIDIDMVIDETIRPIKKNHNQH